MAFLIVLTLGGTIALAVYVYLLQGKLSSRLDALNNFLDSVDERLSERSNDLIRRTDEVKNRETSLDEKISQERIDRETATADLFKKSDEFQESLNELRGHVETILSASTENLEKATTSLNAALHGEYQALEERLGTLAANIEVQKDDLKAHTVIVKEVRAANLIHLALQYLANHQPEDASRLMRGVLEETPGHLDARLTGIRADVTRGALPQARELTDTGLALHPDDPGLLTESARIYRLEKNRTERAKLISEGLAKHPDHPGLLFERSLLHTESHRYEGARADLEKLLALGHETAELRYNLGVVLVALGDFPRAIAELRKSLALDPASADTNHSLGLALIHGERYLEAVDFLERARELLPSTVSIRLDLATALRQSGQAEESLRECAVARHLNPGVLRTGLEEALAYQYLGQFNEALSCLDVVLHMSPKMQRARRLKAEILTGIERYPEAAEEWSRMVQDSPNDAYLHATLGEALKKAGQDMAALGCLEAAARMAPNSAPIQVSFAREALSQHKFDLVQEVVDQAYPRAATTESRLQFIEIRILLALIANRWISLVPLLSEMGHLLGENPHVLPMNEDIRIDSQTVLHLGLSREAARIHSALLDLFDGAIQFPDFEELVTRVMRSMLPVKPAPKPAEPEPVSTPTPAEMMPPSVEPAPAMLPTETVAETQVIEPVAETVAIVPESQATPVTGSTTEEQQSGPAPEAPPETTTPSQPSGPPQPHKHKKRDHHPHRRG